MNDNLQKLDTLYQQGYDVGFETGAERWFRIGMFIGCAIMYAMLVWA